MARQRFKRIQAGRLVREALWTASFPNDTPKARAEKIKCTSAARQRMNDKYCWQKLKMVLAANFSYTDLVLTLTYDDDHLPRNKEAARKLLKKFLQELRVYRKNRHAELKYIYCTEDKHGDARIHHHVVINGTGADYDLIYSLWTHGTELHFEPVDSYGYEELAKYITKEPRECGHSSVGGRSWVPSLNLQKPDVKPTEWVDGNMRLEPPANAYILQTESFENEWGRFSYVEYLLPAEPVAKKTRPRKKKK